MNPCSPIDIAVDERLCEIRAHVVRSGGSNERFTAAEHGARVAGEGIFDWLYRAPEVRGERNDGVDSIYLLISVLFAVHFLINHKQYSRIFEESMTIGIISSIFIALIATAAIRIAVLAISYALLVIAGLKCAVSLSFGFLVYICIAVTYAWFDGTLYVMGTRVYVFAGIGAIASFAMMRSEDAREQRLLAWLQANPK